MKRCLSLGLLILAACSSWPATGAEPFEPRDGDRVVFLGNTLIERDQEQGYLETELISRWPDRNITFRNLAWSGDTVFGDARAAFDTAKEGFKRLKELVLANNPTVIFVSYGTNESFAGEAGLPQFTTGLNTLLDTIAASQAQIVIVSPIKQENLGPPLPDPTAQNGRLQKYCEVLRETAQQRGYRYVDLFQALSKKTKTELDTPLTENGLHLSPYGYWRLARTVQAELGLDGDRWDVTIDAKGNKDEATGTKLGDVQRSPMGVKFKSFEGRLPTPVPAQHGDSSRVLRIANLTPGKYTLKIDGREIVTKGAADWAAGVRLVSGPEFDQVEKLRQAIAAKNQLYFYRWRPQNETYLFGFRKHEQGKNAAEVVQFDPLIAEREAEIATLRVPTPHTLELTRQPEDK